MSLMRIVCGGDDYVAHRVFLGLLPRVGIGTCYTICEAVIANNMNYRNLFYQPLPAGVFTGRALTALNRARGVCGQLSTWQSADTIGQRMADISAIINSLFGPQEVQIWQAYALSLPAGMTLEELRDFLWADTDEQQAALLEAVYERLNLPVPAGGLLPPRVRVMTMHGAKGLSARVVFIPGLEEETLPGPWRQPHAPGGPTHVLITDREAEHIPGCNMAFWRDRLLKVGMFDPAFRTAGDDVDLCWRLQNDGDKLGFAAAALVWHRRRNSVRAYLQQQRGYGQAEAMLYGKHPFRFDRLGHSRWLGRIYSDLGPGILSRRPVVYSGPLGSGLFQTLYEPPASLLRYRNICT